MYKTRMLSERLLRLAEHFPAVVVTGARQVGKSTLVRHLFPKADYVLFDPVQDVENARSEPDIFLANHRRPLVLDEIQYAPELVPAIKRHIDQGRSPGQYILTGSQQWAVMKSISESLAGRAVIVDLDGFSLGEIAKSTTMPWLAAWLGNNEKFGPASRLHLDHPLYETLWRGFLPEATLMPLDVVQSFHDSYLRTYIERDARQLADVSDWTLFGRFVRLIAALTSQEVNYSQVGRELGLNPQTSRRWLDILKATFQWFEVPAFHRSTIKRISSKPKGYIADTGFACSAQAISSPQAIAGHPLWGALFETAVVNEIRKQRATLSPVPNMYHWRTYRDAEVDVILELDGVFYPIEVKAASRPSRKDTSGILAFRKAYPDIRIAKGLVVAPTETFMQLSKTDYAIPWDSAASA
jgi:predicted AAA+ superfamily ATPase